LPPAFVERLKIFQDVSIMRPLSIFSFTVSILCFAFLSDLSGQNGKSVEELSDAELKEYVKVDLALGELRRERKKEAMEVLQNSELGVKGYRRAAAKEEDPDQELSEEKKKAVKELRKEVKGVQKEYRKKERAKMEEMGMKASRYREIEEMMEKEDVRKRMIRIKEKVMEQAQEE
jgi:hypothetical protein